MTFNQYIQAHPVFTLQELYATFANRISKVAIYWRVRRALETDKVTLLKKGLYATVFAGSDPDAIQPDRFLILQALRPDAIFCGHSALELLGRAHSDWSRCTAYSRERYLHFNLKGVEYKTVSYPARLTREQSKTLGVEVLYEQNTKIRFTGPERTLVEGFWNQKLIGGLEELIESSLGMGFFNLKLVDELLEAYNSPMLYSSLGWYFEHYQKMFFVPDTFLEKLESRKLVSTSYLDRGPVDNVLSRRWNLLVPEPLYKVGVH